MPNPCSGARTVHSLLKYSNDPCPFLVFFFLNTQPPKHHTVDAKQLMSDVNSERKAQFEHSGASPFGRTFSRRPTMALSHS